MTFFILTIFILFTGASEAPPSVFSKVFTTRTECELAEGTALTDAYTSENVIGWYITDECTPVDKVSKA